MDISVFRAVAAELAGTLPGAKLSEVEEDGRGGIILVFRVPGTGRTGVYVYPRPDLPRIYLLTGIPKTARSLTPSVQAIRNEVAGSVVESVEYEGFERTLALRLTRRRRGSSSRASLVYELAGKKPNLIALDGDGKVLAALSYASLTDEGPRPLLVGLNYCPPPRPDKLDPVSATVEDVSRVLDGEPYAPPDKALFGHIWGISPLLAREVAAVAAGTDPEDMTRALKSVMAETLDGPYSPRVYDTPKGPVLAAFELRHMGDAPSEKFEGMSRAAERHYALMDGKKRYASLRSKLLQSVRRELRSVERRVRALESDMSSVENAEAYAHFGNLLMASLRDVPRNAESVTLPDMFADGQPEITIPLDAALDGVRNAERYFRKSRKARQGAEIVSGRLADAVAERDLLLGRIEEIESAETVDGLESVAATAGGGRGAAGSGGRVRTAELPHFVSSDGFEVFYGKNAKQNDTVTFRFAGPMDLWFHAQGYHGAHVVVRNPDRRPDIPLATILEAASVAAYFSKAKKDRSVPVDYTFRKYVRKPRDPVPGQAIFTQNKTVFVDPKPPGGEG